MARKKGFPTKKEQNLSSDISLEDGSEEADQKYQVPDIWQKHPSKQDVRLK